MVEEHEIKAIFFDAGGTLLYIHPSVGKVYADVTREMGVELSDERIETRLHEIWEEYAPTNCVREGDYRASDERDRNMWKEFLRRLYDDLEPLQQLEFDEWFENVFDRFGEPGTFQLYDESMETIRRLKQADRYVGVVSNWDSRLLSICEGLGIDDHVDFILPSAVAGYRKPSERIFEQALDTADVRPEEAMHIGDKTLDDYEGSKSAGLTPVLLDRNNRERQGEKRVISSLDQVTDLLNLNANTSDLT